MSAPPEARVAECRSRNPGSRLAACEWWARQWPGMQGAEIPGVAPRPGGALVSPPACADARLAGHGRSTGIPLPPPKLSEAFRSPASSRGPAPAGILRMPRRADPAYPACQLHSPHASATPSHPSYVGPGYLKMRPAMSQDANFSKIVIYTLRLLQNCHNLTFFGLTNTDAGQIHSRREASLNSLVLPILFDHHVGFVCSWYPN